MCLSALPRPSEQAGPRHAEQRWQVRGPVHAVEMLCEQPHHCAKDHTSIQMNVTEVDRVTSRFNGQFKTYAICGAICRMGESDDYVLRLAKDDGNCLQELLTRRDQGKSVINKNEKK